MLRFKKALILTVATALVAGASGGASAALEEFTGYSGSLFSENGGSTTGSVAWTGSWGDQGFASSANIVNSSMTDVNTVDSQDPFVEYPLDNSQGGINVLESTRGFTALSGQSSIYVYGLVAVGQDGGFVSGESFGGIGLYEGSTEKFLLGQRFEETNWGATTAGALGGSGSNTSTAIGNFVSVLLAAKIDQVTNQMTFWINPDFDQAEGANTPAFTLSWGGGDDDDIDTVRLRGGNAGNGNKWQFDNLEITLDAPFIPTPAALPAGLAMLGAVAMRRRRK